jgi:hypothetical protein
MFKKAKPQQTRAGQFVDKVLQDRSIIDKIRQHHTGLPVLQASEILLSAVVSTSLQPVSRADPDKSSKLKKE